VTSWRWDFGDGDTSIVQNPFHIYSQPGDYTVCLEATDNCGTGQTCKIVTVGCISPITNFMITITGATIQCVDNSDNYPSAWVWSFGDGGSSTEQNPTYTYAAPGNYQVCLDAQNACGSNILCATIPIGCALPQAAFGFQTNELEVSFSDNSTDNVDSWQWDFGDGNTSTNPSPIHQYSASGTYLVCLTVENDCGTDVSCFPVTVSCAPPPVGYAWTTSNLNVAFVATNTDVDTYAWDFGDGVGTSNISNPLYTYDAPGAYEVCLTVTDECGSTQLCQTIQVQCPAPQAAFNFATNQLNVSFLDNSNIQADSWAWDFGDGATSADQNPQHSYAAPGTYQVCLTITGTCGTDEFCTIVTVDCPAPTPIFGYITNELMVDFVDFSAGNPDAWSWNFGDGQFSNEQSPIHTYSIPGTYTVCLTASGTCGAQQVCQDVTVACTPPSVGFQGTNDGSLTWVFNNLSGADATSFLWDFGDGNTSMEVDPVYTYAEAGTYTICLTATSICGSTEVCETVTVQCLAPASAFGFQTNGLAVAFSDGSVNGPTAWLWDFGDGTTSVAQNPQHDYAAPGTYTVCLTTTNSCGEDIQCTAVQVNCAPPAAGFLVQTDGLSITLTDLSSNNPASWLWTFGDGTTSEEQNPDHSYAMPGNYEICLTVSSVCGSTTACETIPVSCAPPASGFSASSDTPLVVHFEDLSTGGPTSWLWDFGDGTTATTQNPTHTYATAGSYQVCLTASSVCGNTTTCTTVDVTCPAPVAGFIFGVDELSLSMINTSSGFIADYSWTFGDGGTSTAQSPSYTYSLPGTYEVCLTAESICGTSQFCQMVTVSCPAPSAAFSTTITDLGVQFSDNSTDGVSSWLWDFGDGTTSGEISPFHVYGLPGTYTVCLTVNGICGQDQTCSEVVVTCVAPAADFALVPNGLSVDFIDASTNSPSGWLWNFGDGAISTEANPTHTYDSPGTYQVCLAVNSICGSSETCLTVEVSCAAPAAAFTIAADQLAHAFTDQSTQGPTAWLWDFGDGTTSTMQNPEHTYSAPGSYTVCLTAESICGSSQSCTNIVVTCSAPQADFEVSADELTLTFNDVSMNSPTAWLWNFGDGTTATDQMPTHTYATPGNYLVCLEVESVCGSTQRCEVIAVSCTPVQADFDFASTDLLVQFSNTTPGTPDQLVWDFGDGATSFEENPAHQYDMPGSYEVCLQIVEVCGTSEYCQIVEISCPAPVAAFGVVVDGSMVTCSDFSNPTPTAWLWDFGDGNTSTEASPSHTYTESGMFNICLTAATICGSSTACQEVNIVISSVSENQVAPPSMALFPNPARNQLWVMLQTVATEEAMIVLHDVTGRPIQQKAVAVVQGEGQVVWDVADLPAYVCWYYKITGSDYVLDGCAFHTNILTGTKCYNNCDHSAFPAIISEDFEFFHDQAGKMEGVFSD
jgi:PKD repeat protein